MANKLPGKLPVLLTPAEVAEYLGASEWWVTNKSPIPKVKIARRTRIREDDLLTYIEQSTFATPLEIAEEIPELQSEISDADLIPARRVRREAKLGKTA